MELSSLMKIVAARYWVWMDGLRVYGIYRLHEGLFHRWNHGTWESSDYYERASQDPEFVEKSELEISELINLDSMSSLRPQSKPD